jgi:hypothetical protein
MHHATVSGYRKNQRCQQIDYLPQQRPIGPHEHPQPPATVYDIGDCRWRIADKQARLGQPFCSITYTVN